MHNSFVSFTSLYLQNLVVWNPPISRDNTFLAGDKGVKGSISWIYNKR